MNRRSNQLLACLLAAAFCVAGLTSCGPTDPSTAEYWIVKLKTKERKQAIRQLAGMGETAFVAVPHLVKMYDQNKEKGDVVVALAQLRPGTPELRPQVLDRLAKAIVDPTEQAAAAAAAAALGEMGATEKLRDLIGVLGTTMEDEVKAAALRSLIKLKDPSVVDDLIKVVDGDPDKQWIHLNELACQALGEIGMPTVEKALPAMVRGIFLRDRFQRLAFKGCALALIKCGDPAAVAVLNAMDGKDPVLQELAVQRGFVDGLIAEEGVKMLSLLRYKPAAARVQQELVVKLIPPQSYDEKKQEMWSIIEAQRFQNSIDTLGRIGDDATVAELAKWLYKDEYLRRVRVPFALTAIGTPAAYKELLKAAQTAILDKDKTWFRIDCAQQLAFLAGPGEIADLEGVQKVIEKIEPELKALQAAEPQAGAQDFLDRIEGFRQNIAALRECQEAIPCWTGKLKDKNPFVREKAVWTLARSKDPQGLDVLLANLGTPEFELRNWILNALPLVCDQRCVPALEGVIAAEADKVAFKGFRDLMTFVLAQVRAR
ncbi:MAG: hypothetical protein RBU45_20575 [Myxococcota bacterium]|jgi:HEAT repeat protein|nr:hypothetical protein [Myxococcota bacterium]